MILQQELCVDRRPGRMPPRSPRMPLAVNPFTDLLRSRSAQETVRAFVIFGVLVALLTAIAGNLMLRQLDLQVMQARLDAAWGEARRIADVVSALGRDREGIDFHRVRQNRAALETVINERIGARASLRWVDIRDRFGTRIVFVVPDRPGDGPLTALSDDLLGESDFALPPVARVVRLPVRGRGSVPAGEVRVGIADEAVRRELLELRRTLRLQIVGAALAAVAVLVAGLFYVLHLIRKNRRLELSRVAAERRSYVGLLASGLAHEIRNPLSAMNMNLQMLEEELSLSPEFERSEHRELLEQSKSEIQRLEQLVTNFLAYARPAPPKLETVDLNEVVARTAKFVEAEFRAADVRLTLELDPQSPTVQLDATQFRQALLNLVVNARQVLGPGGAVVVRTTTRDPDGVDVEVEDDGPGIPEELRGRVFEVFYSTRGGGTGLGLPIARQIVERHGGSLEFETHVGRGTKFRIRLARRPPPAREHPESAP